MKNPLKQLRAWLKRPRYVHPTIWTDVRVLIIETETGDVASALGITEERNKFLISALERINGENEKLSMVMAKMSEHCKHPNELAFVAFALGDYMGRQSFNPFKFFGAPRP